MLVKTFFKNIPISCKKLKFLIKKISNLSLENILIYLNFLNTKNSFFLKKIIINGIFNSINNFNLKINDLKIFHFIAQKGFCLKRVFYKAKGRFTFYKKYRSNLILILFN